MSIKHISFIHYVKIDHWEKDEWGDKFMVDVYKRRWLSYLWKNKDYEYDPRSPQRPIIRTMKQNRKVIKFYTFHEEDISDKYRINGCTMSFEDVAKEFLNVKYEKLAKDSIDTILNLLLE